MTLHPSWPLAVLALAGLLTQTATAQDIHAFSEGFGIAVEGQPLDNAPEVQIGLAHCAQGVEFTLKVSGLNVPSGISALEFWAGPGPDVDCALSEHRRTTVSSPPSCWFVGKVAFVTTTASLRVDARALFWPDSGRDPGTCQAHDGDAVTIHAVPLDTPTSANPSNPAPPIGGVRVRTATLTLVTALPSAPSGLQGQSTSDFLELSWEADEDRSAGSVFTVFWDNGVGSDASCSTSRLQAGQAAPALELDEDFMFATTTRGTRYSLLQLDERNIRIGDYVAVGVVQRGPGGNVSLLSEVLCLERPRRARSARPDADITSRDTGCSVLSGTRSPGRLDLSALCLLGAWLVVRRRSARPRSPQ
jgi:hypothetical protein